MVIRMTSNYIYNNDFTVNKVFGCIELLGRNIETIKYIQKTDEDEDVQYFSSLEKARRKYQTLVIYYFKTIAHSTYSINALQNPVRHFFF